MSRWYLTLSIILILSGGLVFYKNYDLETIPITMDLEEAILLDYTAPESDPFAHYLLVEVDTSKAVSISETLDGVNHIIFTDDGRGRFTVESGQSIHIVLSNPNRAVGTVNTTFYCESWNYAAYTLTGIGIIIFVLWYFRSDDEYNEEL